MVSSPWLAVGIFYAAWVVIGAPQPALQPLLETWPTNKEKAVGPPVPFVPAGREPAQPARLQPPTCMRCPPRPPTGEEFPSAGSTDAMQTRRTGTAQHQTCMRCSAAANRSRTNVHTDRYGCACCATHVPTVPCQAQYEWEVHMYVLGSRASAFTKNNHIHPSVHVRRQSTRGGGLEMNDGETHEKRHGQLSLRAASGRPDPALRGRHGNCPLPAQHKVGRPLPTRCILRSLYLSPD